MRQMARREVPVNDCSTGIERAEAMLHHALNVMMRGMSHLQDQLQFRLVQAPAPFISMRPGLICLAEPKARDQTNANRPSKYTMPAFMRPSPTSTRFRSTTD